GLYLCLDQECNLRLDQSSKAPNLGGRLYTEPHLHCGCESKSRVYELLTHRHCGAAFIRGYAASGALSFRWHEPTQPFGAASGERLTEFHLLIDGQPHPKVLSESQKVWIDISSGQVSSSEESPGKTWRSAYISNHDPEQPGRIMKTFLHCPVCLK